MWGSQLGFGNHHMGTTRMSDSYDKGVVDSNQRVFGTKNFFIGGSSVFPTGGHVPPTLTIAAMTIRLAEHIKGLFEKPQKKKNRLVPPATPAATTPRRTARFCLTLQRPVWRWPRRDDHPDPTPSPLYNTPHLYAPPPALPSTTPTEPIKTHPPNTTCPAAASPNPSRSTKLIQTYYGAAVA